MAKGEHTSPPVEDDSEAAVRDAAFRECSFLRAGPGAKETLAKDVLSLVYGVRCDPCADASGGTLIF